MELQWNDQPLCFPITKNFNYCYFILYKNCLPFTFNFHGMNVAENISSSRFAQNINHEEQLWMELKQ